MAYIGMDEIDFDMFDGYFSRIANSLESIAELLKNSNDIAEDISWIRHYLWTDMDGGRSLAESAAEMAGKLCGVKGGIDVNVREGD